MVRQNMLIAVDVAAFTVSKGVLQVLLVKRKNPPFRGQYAFPGGFVENGESLEEAALRELEEETGVKEIFLQQLGAYGNVKRDPRGRIISIAFTALIDSERFRLKSRADAMVAEWVNVGRASDYNLAFDHEKILEDAMKELRFEIQTTNIAAQILPEKFTLTELQELYERVMGEKLDKRNFRKRIKALDILISTKETKMEGAHRPALLYRFRSRDYKPLKDRINVFV